MAKTAKNNRRSNRVRWRKPYSVRFFTPLVLLLTVIFPTLSIPAPPVPFDGWSNRRGVITAPCPRGYSCITNVSDTGILQRYLTDQRTGRRFIQLIVSDGVLRTDGEMILENFVEMSSAPGNVDGTALKQIITQRGEYNMDYSIVLNTGWADDPNTPTVDLSQTITDTTPEGVGFDYTFDYTAHLGPNDAVTGYFFGIRQSVTNSGRLNGSNGGGQDIHTFVLRRASGSFVRSGSASLPAAAGGMGGAVGGGAGGGAGGGMMAAASNTTGGTSNTIAPRGNTGSTLVRVNGTSTGAGDPPCGSDPPTNIRPGEPPRCRADPAPTNPGSQGTGTGAGAAAPGGTLTVPPRGSGTIPVPPQPPGAGGGIPMGMGGGGPAGGSVSWTAGNEVQVIWIGQVCPGCVAAAMGGMGGANGSFSYQAYENLSTGATAATRTIFGSAPFTWTDPPFGPQPGL
ncbi:MAG: hypothetical protein OEZ43_19375 [Gammaproteobacteria bacterium]|nr:hypothetical protein [Gammaproteobacteria bacterium]